MRTFPPSWLLSSARGLFAVAVVFFGGQHLVYGAFVTRIMPPWPPWVPATTFLPYAVGVMLVVAGLAMLLARTARCAALLLGFVTLSAALLVALPIAWAHANWGGEWTNVGKALALGGGAFVLAATLPAGAGQAGDPVLVLIGRLCFSGFLILCGIQHFLWVQFVTQLVPAWIPGSLFWAYFSGGALIAGGIGLLVVPTRRLAGLLTAGMIFLWLILLHIPRALADLHNANESTAVFEAGAMSAIALLLAAASRPAAST